MREESRHIPTRRFGSRVRRISVGALLLAVGAQGVFVFSRATAILVDGVSDAVLKVLS